jgi:hypothetical protein
VVALNQSLGRSRGRRRTLETDAICPISKPLSCRLNAFIFGLQEIEWVFLATSERWKHACEHLEPQIFLVA